MASIYDKQILSDADFKRIVELGNAWNAATDKNVRAGLHQQAEAIRNSYGYSGGGDGAQFIIQSTDVLNTANANKAYTNALQNAADAEAASFDAMSDKIEQNKDERLREAYIKNMQDSLGLGQQLKSAGVSGGASESTRAFMNNVYSNNRNDIINSALSEQSDVDIKRAEAASKTLADIAKAEYDGAKERNSSLRYAEQTAYDRSMDEYYKQKDERDFNYNKQKDERDFAYNQQKDQRDFDYNKYVDQRDFDYQKQTDQRDFDYQKQTDQRDFDYQKQTDQRDFDYNKYVDQRDFDYNKQKDERDFEYNKENDEKNRQTSSKKSSSSSSSSSSTKFTPSSVLSLIKSGIYNADFAEILGITDDEVRDMVENYKSEESKNAAWKLMANGIFDESFPEIVGFSREVLVEYVNSVLNGY